MRYFFKSKNMKGVFETEFKIDFPRKSDLFDPKNLTTPKYISFSFRSGKLAVRTELRHSIIKSQYSLGKFINLDVLI